MRAQIIALIGSYRTLHEVSSFSKIPVSCRSVCLDGKKDVLDTCFAGGPGYLLLHGSCIAPQEGEDIYSDPTYKVVRHVHECLFENAAGFIEAIEREI